VVIGKEVAQGKMDAGPHAEKKEESQLGWFGNLAHGRSREEKYFSFYLSNLYRLQTHMSSSQI
jgi:hypothetical protein